jgi:hypothetical protein
MDLDGAGGYFRWTLSGWDQVLGLAEGFGWEPGGTGPPRGVRKSEWGGGYYSNNGQRFYAKDARRLADALERALAAPPEQRARWSDWLTAEQTAALRAFVEFCRAGSFRLW